MELLNIQLHLAVLRPPNYGILSGIILHLMRHVIVNSRTTHTFIQDAFRDLCFIPIMERFGMFFLHQLNIKAGTLKEISQEDTPDVIHAYGKSLKKSLAPPPRPHQVTAANHAQMYPWGPKPSWPRVQQLLDTEKAAFIQKWEFSPESMEVSKLQSELLFVQFTCDLWLSLADGFAAPGVLPKPKTLAEALCSWAVSSVQDILGADGCRFLASADGLTGKIPPNLKRSFSESRQIFFPHPTVEIPQKSIWFPYTTGTHYISTYHHYLKTWDEEEVQDLHNDLDHIFSHLQCLPSSTMSNKSNHSIWTSSMGKVVFVSNPKYYQIQEIGAHAMRTNDGKRSKQAQASLAVLEQQLQEQKGGVTKEEKGTLSKVRTHQEKEESTCQETTKDWSHHSEVIRWGSQRDNLVIFAEPEVQTHHWSSNNHTLSIKLRSRISRHS